MGRVSSGLVLDHLGTLAFVFLAMAVLALAAARQLPQRLGAAIAIAAASVAAIAAVVAHFGWNAFAPHDATIVFAILALWWTVVGAATSRPDLSRSTVAEVSAGALSAALVFGILTSVLVVYALTYTILQRLLGPPDAFAPVPGLVWRAGLVALASLFTAAIVFCTIRRESHQPAIVFMLAVLIGTWLSLAIPFPMGSGTAPAQQFRSTRSDWWQWLGGLHAIQALLVLAALDLFERVRRRRLRDWPDRLECLIEGPPRWDGFIEAVSVVSASVLILAVMQIVRGAPPSRWLVLVSALSSLAAAGGCLTLCERRWNANLFGLGAALTATVCATLPLLFIAPNPRISMSARLPVVQTAALFGLAFAAFLWLWLSRFWRQQLLGELPWTTAGRGIPYARRTGFLVAALAVLIAFQIALWPTLPSVVASDNSPGRWFAGLSAMALLALVTIGDARASSSRAMAALTLATLGAALVFILARWPDTVLRGRIIQYLPIVASLAALPLLALAETIPDNSRWRSFAPPLWFIALLILPAAALLAVLFTRRLPAEWITPMTLATVGGIYALAGSREGRRAFLALSVVLLLAAAFNLSRLYGAALIRS